MGKPPKQAVLLLAHGSPDSPADVPEFLLRVTEGRSLSPAAVDEVRRRYQVVGRSPLTEISFKQGARLAERLGIPVYVGMRNWHPLVSETLGQMAADGIRKAVVICLAPQNSQTSVGLYRRSLEIRSGKEMIFDFVESWHDAPRLIEGFAEKLTAGKETAEREAGACLPVIFTAHSVPERTIVEGDPYERQARETAELVAARAGLERSRSRFAFQSQGMAGGPWLGPTLEETLLDLKRSGYGGVFVQPVGFLCDHVEILYDIDTGFKWFAEKHAMRIWRADSLNDSPLLIAALEEIVHTRLGRKA
jgi:protoporphyrin/coproporphyrin ferrochelatase